jgi:hypothetical protein
VTGLLLPAALGLAALAAVPIVVHWLTRQRARRLDFPAAALLARAAGGLTRRNRLRERVVLALRALALAAAGLAAAGPWLSGLSGDTRPAAIILDASCSMRQVGDGATSFARGRAAAARLVETLAPRPVIAFVAGAEAVRSSPAPTSGAGAAKALLADATASYGDGGLPAAVAAAVRALDGPGDIFVVSDGSRAALAGVDAGRLPDGVRLHLLDAGGGGANRGVVAIACEPGQAVAGRPLRLAARVANYGPEDATVPVRLSCGPAARSADLRVPAGGSAVLELVLTPNDAGWLTASAEIGGGDALAEDDRRDAAIAVLPGLVAVVAGDGARDDAAGALRPLAAGLEAAGFAVRLSDGSGLAAGAADGAALVATAGLSSDAAAPALAAHLAAGGTWLQVLAGEADAKLRPAGAAPPAEPGPRLDLAGEGKAPVTLARARLEHALFEPFAGREALLAQVSALRLIATPGGAAAGAEALASWSDGNVALAERRLGPGRWLMLNASTGAVDATLARSEAWPLLCGRIAALCAAPTREDAAEPAGGAIAAAWLADPAGVRVEAREGRVLLDRPGIWRGDAGRAVAAAVPAGESDLRRLGGGSAPAESAEAAIERAERRPLWPWLLALAAACLAAELLIAGAVGRRAAP